MMRRLLLIVCLVTFTASCRHVSSTIEPVICAPSHPKEIQRQARGFLCLPKDFSISPFLPLTEEELTFDWGKELHIALCFAADFDLYRAITGFKRALCLLPVCFESRKQEILYDIALAYYLGKKYVEAIFSIESTELIHVDESFCAYLDLLLILYDSYEQTGDCEKAAHLFQLIENTNQGFAHKLTLLQAIKLADLPALNKEASSCKEHAYIENVLYGYQKEAKSPKKAETLNALLPGAGYWYVGMKQTAMTAFLINSLFIAAAAHFFHSGNVAAGIVTLSLEGGWYFGGIYGAGLAAKSYNEQLYCRFADKIIRREQPFPLFMLKYTF